MKRHLSNTITLALLIAGESSGFAQVLIPVSQTSGFQNGGVIPDYDINGWVNTASVNSPGNTRITGITVSLEISSDAHSFNSDLYGYLASPSGASTVVLFNRVGQTSSNPFGYGDRGFNVTFDNAAPNDIHLYQNYSPGFSSSGQLLGTWQPDGRPLDSANPYAVPGTTRTSSLDQFLNQNPNGQWKLFIADLSSGGQSTVVSWGMQITAVPEPKGWGIWTALGLTGLFIYKRRHRGAQAQVLR
jgi:subtilisin-like proprotein convertase family protein